MSARTNASRRDIVVVGGSAGALEALRRITAGLPFNFKAALFVVIHTGRDSAKLMAAILERAGRLPASYPEDGDPIVAGRIHVAMPDHHLLLEGGAIRVVKGPRENGFRPAVDPLFRSAARSHGARVIGVILSGGQNDGSLGMAAIRRAGGLTVAQRPEDAIVPGMPESAIEFSGVDHVLDIDQIPALLIKETSRERKRPMAVRKKAGGDGRKPRPDPAEAGTDLMALGAANAPPPTVFICPECGGPLWEANDGGLLRYRCHVGHAFTGESLLTAQSDAVEQALWTALRNLEEGAALRRRMSEHARDQGLWTIADQFEERQHELEQSAAVVRKVLVVDDLTTREQESPARVAGRARKATKA